MNRLVDICKQLYEIGYNDGKNNINYLPRPYIDYAEKIKEEILGLEELKEEKEMYGCEQSLSDFAGNMFRNQLRTKIKEAINNLGK